MTAPDDDYKLIYKIDYQDSIRLADFAKSLKSLDAMFIKHNNRNKYLLPDTKPCFHIKEINKGSIEVELLAIFGNLLVFREDIKNIMNFLIDTSRFIAYLRGLQEEAPFPYDKRDLANMKGFVSPAVYGGGTQVNISTNEGGIVNVYTAEAKEVHEGANRKLSALHQPEVDFKTNELLYFRVTEYKHGESKYTKGVIESISNDLVSVYSPDPDIMEAILQNPYHRTYLVDVRIKYVEGNASLYIIEKLHQTFPR